MLTKALIVVTLLYVFCGFGAGVPFSSWGSNVIVVTLHYVFGGFGAGVPFSSWGSNVTVVTNLHIPPFCAYSWSVSSWSC